MLTTARGSWQLPGLGPLRACRIYSVFAASLLAEGHQATDWGTHRRPGPALRGDLRGGTGVRWHCLVETSVEDPGREVLYLSSGDGARGPAMGHGDTGRPPWFSNTPFPTGATVTCIRRLSSDEPPLRPSRPGTGLRASPALAPQWPLAGSEECGCPVHWALGQRSPGGSGRGAPAAAAWRACCAPSCCAGGWLRLAS